MRRRWILPVAVLATALGCATTPGPAALAPTGADGVEVAVDPGASAAPDDVFTPRTYRLGFWVIDLVALDRAPRRTTFRLLDLKITKLLEIGGGEDYHSFALLETPGVIEPITWRRDGATQEVRLVDLQALALLRRTRESRTQEETLVVKPPVLRALYGTRVDGPKKTRDLFFVYRQEVD